MNKKLLLVLSTSLLLFQISCNRKKQAEAQTPPTPSNLSGEQLAKTYCASCHLFPEPSLLDKSTWLKGVLPKMAYRLGMANSFDLLLNMDKENMQAILDANIYPDQPMMAEEDWKKIMDYYAQNAPEKPIPQDKKEAISQKNTLFKLHPFAQKQNRLPLTTLVKFNTKDKTVYIGNRLGFIEIFDLNGIRKDSIAVPSTPSDIDFTTQPMQILSMGIMDPNDLKKGKLIMGNKTLLDSLRRPVQMTYADLNQDTKPELILCNYGNEVGNLSWYEVPSMKEHSLKPISGARNVVVTDLNKDGFVDIVALMAQAREGIFVFYNDGNGESPSFEEKNLLEFPSVYGSSYFELADFNKDGFQDILYSNGDNADYSHSAKAYHGIRIFLNDGKNNFKQSYFYPMYGASKAQAADFDLDGDLDIAGISFFPENSTESFVYLENQGNFHFKASTFKETLDKGLLVMDIADMDADGDKDIILGSFMKFTPNSSTKNQYKAVILENKTK